MDSMVKVMVIASMYSAYFLENRRLIPENSVQVHVFHLRKRVMFGSFCLLFIMQWDLCGLLTLHSRMSRQYEFIMKAQNKVNAFPCHHTSI